MENEMTFAFGELPEFATVASQEVFLCLGNQEKLLARLQNEEKAHSKRLSILSSHRENILEELDLVRNVTMNAEKSLNLEEHLRIMAEMKQTKLKDIVMRFKHKNKIILEKEITIKSDIFTQQSDIDNLKHDIKVDEKLLNDWILVKAQKEEEEHEIDEYVLEDIEKIQELKFMLTNLIRHKNLVAEQSYKQKSALTIKYAELSKDINYVDNCQQQHLDVSSKIKVLLTMLRQKDENIQKISDLSAIIQKDHANTVKELLMNEGENLRILSDTKNLERLTQVLHSDFESITHAAFLKKRQKNDLKERCHNLQIENLTLDRTITKKQKRYDDVVLTTEIITEKVKAAEQEMLKLYESLEGQQHFTKNKKALARISEEIILCEEQKGIKLDKDLLDLNQHLFKVNKALLRILENEKQLGLNLKLVTSRIKNSSDKIEALRKTSIGIQQVIYETEFKVTLAEQRLRYVQGERSEEEKSALTMEIQKLESVLKDCKSREVMLKRENKNMKSDLIVIKRKIEENSNHKQRSSTHLQGLLIKLTKLRKMKQNMLFEKNALQENLEEIEATKSKQKSNLLSKLHQLSVYDQSQLATAKNMTKGRLVMTAEVDKLKFKAKLLEEEIREYNVLKKELDREIYQLQRKYEGIKCNHPLDSDASDSENKQERSQSYYIIKNAQRKASLQDSVSKLQEDFLSNRKQTEKLSLASKRLTQKNIKFRNNLQKINSKSREYNTINDLLEKRRVNQAKNLSCKREVHILHCEISKQNLLLNAIKKDIENAIQEKINLENKIGNIAMDISSLQLALNEVNERFIVNDKSVSVITDSKLKTLWIKCKNRMLETAHQSISKVLQKLNASIEPRQ